MPQDRSPCGCGCAPPTVWKSKADSYLNHSGTGPSQPHLYGQVHSQAATPWNQPNNSSNPSPKPPSAALIQQPTALCGPLHEGCGEDDRRWFCEHPQPSVGAQCVFFTAPPLLALPKQQGSLESSLYLFSLRLVYVKGETKASKVSLDHAMGREWLTAGPLSRQHTGC